MVYLNHFKKMIITPDIIDKHGITSDEYKKIVKLISNWIDRLTTNLLLIYFIFIPHLKFKVKLSEYYYSDISLVYFIKIFVPPFSLWYFLKSYSR